MTLLTIDTFRAKQSKFSTKMRIARRRQLKGNLEEYDRVKIAFHELDTQSIPGIVFFDADFISKHGVCPFAWTGCESRCHLLAQRRDWLSSSPERENDFKEIADSIVHKVRACELKSKLEHIEDTVYQTLNTTVGETLSLEFKCIVEFIQEYTKSRTHSKQKKEMYAHSIKRIQEISSMSLLRLDTFVNVTCNHDIGRIDLPKSVSEGYLAEYLVLSDLLLQENTVISTKLSAAYTNLFKYTTSNETIDDRRTCTQNSRGINKDLVGKKWSSLSKELRDSSISEYIEYFFSRVRLDNETSVKFNGVDTPKTDVIQNVTQVYNGARRSVSIKWNTTTGRIDCIKELKLVEKSHAVAFTFVPKVVTGGRASKHKVATLQIQESEINDAMLNDVLSVIYTNGSDADTSETAKAFSDGLAAKHGIKKMNTVTSLYITESYDRMYKIVCEN